MKNNWHFWLIGILSLGIIILTLTWNYNYATKLGKDYQGIYGDMFGASNALFTGLSFTGVIIAILLQRQELKLQRQELELTRREMELTRKEFVTQNSTLKIQQFENTFFHILSLFHSIVDNMNISLSNGSTYKGRAVFDYMNGEINRLVEIGTKPKINLDLNKPDLYQKEIFKLQEAITKKDMIDIYNVIYYKNKNILAHYFTTLYNIFKLIHNNKLIDRNIYVSIVKAQLSSSEQILLFYNCLHNNGNKKFKPLVETYGILDNIDYNLLPNKSVADWIEVKEAL